MGVWGTAILSDDFARDVYDGYLDAYDDGAEHSTIRARLEADNKDAIDDVEEESVFWLALARAQWDCGVLEPDVLQVVRDIVIQGRGLSRWREASEKLALKRELVVAAFLDKIQVPRERPRKRRRVRHISTIYNPGDCLAIHLPDGEYGAAMVIAKDDHLRRDGLDLVGVLRYKSAAKPNRFVFENAPWLVLNHHNWQNVVDVRWCFAFLHKKWADTFEVIDRIAPRPIPPLDYPGHAPYSDWDFRDQVMLQFAWEQDVREGP